jgi:hypothetical protein
VLFLPFTAPVDQWSEGVDETLAQSFAALVGPLSHNISNARWHRGDGTCGSGAAVVVQQLSVNRFEITFIIRSPVSGAVLHPVVWIEITSIIRSPVSGAVLHPVVWIEITSIIRSPESGAVLHPVVWSKC